MGRLTDTLIQKGGSNLTPAAILTQNMDISGWVYNTLSTLTRDVTNSTRIMDSNMVQLDKSNLETYTSNRRALTSNTATASLLTFTMSFNFINAGVLTTQPILDANKQLSNLVRDSNTFLRADLATLESSFYRTYSNVSSNILSSITTEYNKFTRSFPIVIGTLPYINNNMNTAYPIMAASNYVGKYTYYYDYISAMFGRNSNILNQARTSNFPKNVEAPNPIIYIYNSLYYPNGDIILASSMYPYISDRYFGSNYNNLSNQFMTIFNTPRSTPNSNRSILSRLQACNAIFTVDSMQLSNYSNTIASDSNIATTNGLRRYVGSVKSDIFNANNPLNAGIKSTITGQLNTLYSNTIRPRSIQLMSNIETALTQNQTDMYFFKDTDFSNLATFRGNLKQYYIKADFINYNNSNYFQPTFSNSNGTIRGTYFAVNELDTVCTIGLFMSNDSRYIDDTLAATDFNNITTSFRTGYSNASNTMRTNIANTLSNINTTYNNTLAITDSTIRRTSTDIKKLQDRRLDGTCFTFFPKVTQASNQLNTIMNQSLPRLYGEYTNALNTYMTTTSLSNLNTMSESLLYTSNNLYNNYLTASNLSNTLTGLADNLVTIFSNTYSNYPLDIVYNLPIFTGASCGSN